jgi:mono/diheme cytochrome c family protein
MRLAVAVVFLLAGCVGREAVPPAAAPAPTSFDPARVATGAKLAALGNCATCHTAPGGKPYAGGRALKTPFGTVYGTNITPDVDTGIGDWSEAAFARAMREGIARDGRHLYPAFPYDHFTRLSDADIAALYAFVMTREPVRNVPPKSALPIPRAAVAMWNSLYLKKGEYRPDPAKSAQWNRGAYLVEGLAHCGACHTPRNFAGAEKRDAAFSGGESEDWHAPALNGESPSPVPWDEDALDVYLRTGIAERHAVTAGPMSEVTRTLAQVPEADVRAIAAYIMSLGPGEAKRPAAPAGANPAIARGKLVYAGACGECHDRGRGAEGGALPLELATGLTMPTPRNLIHIIRDGIVPPAGESGAWMPAYAGALTEPQLADLVAYLRALAGAPPWRDVAGEVRRIAEEKR